MDQNAGVKSGQSGSEQSIDGLATRRDLVRWGVRASVFASAAALPVLPARWRRPIVDSLVLPAHAQATLEDRVCVGANNLRPTHRLRISDDNIGFRQPGETVSINVTVELVNGQGMSDEALNAMRWNKIGTTLSGSIADRIDIVKDLPNKLVVGRRYEMQLRLADGNCIRGSATLDIEGEVCAATAGSVQLTSLCAPDDDDDERCTVAPLTRVELNPSFIEFRATQDPRELVITHETDTPGSTEKLLIESIFINGGDANYFEIVDDFRGELAPGESAVIRVRIPAGFRCSVGQVGKPKANLNIVSTICASEPLTTQLELSIECTVLED